MKSLRVRLRLRFSLLLDDDDAAVLGGTLLLEEDASFVRTPKVRLCKGRSDCDERRLVGTFADDEATGGDDGGGLMLLASFSRDFLGFGFTFSLSTVIVSWVVGAVGICWPSVLC